MIDDAVMLDPHPTSLNQVMHHHLLLAHLHSAQGDTLTAQATLQGALEQEPYATQVIMAQDLKIYQALFSVRQGQVVMAGQLLRQLSPYPLPAHLVGDGLLRMAWAELFLAQRQYAEAEAILTLPGKTSIHSANFDVLPYRNLLLALACWGQQKVSQAQQELGQALRLAESEGIVRPFLDCGLRLVPLLVDILDRKTLNRLHREFVGGLLAEFSVTYPELSIAAEQAAAPVAVSLTPREQEILRLLDEGMDNKAMARRLVIADSTLRTHLRNIYAKLEVTSRIQAVRQARRLKLL
jgi:LuxR family maltose regulon positive regulatory protein